MMKRWPMLLVAFTVLAAVACTTRAQRRTGPSTTTVYVDDSPPLPPTPEEKRRGFVLFSREMTRVLFPGAVPAAGDPPDLRGLVVVDRYGNRHEFWFDGIARDAGLDDGLFVFTVPPDVEVVHARAGESLLAPGP